MKLLSVWLLESLVAMAHIQREFHGPDRVTNANLAETHLIDEIQEENRPILPSLGSSRQRPLFLPHYKYFLSFTELAHEQGMLEASM